MTAEVVPLPRRDPASLEAHVREEIKVLMTRRRLSGVELGRITGKGQPWVSRRLRDATAKGAAPIDMESLAILASALGVRASAVLEAAERALAEADTPQNVSAKQSPKVLTTTATQTSTAVRRGHLSLVTSAA